MIWLLTVWACCCVAIALGALALAVDVHEEYFSEGEA